MVNYSTATEIRIKTAARDIFLEKGKDGAKMQLIAERAGVNKALLHYYFRSKEKLYIAVLKDSLKEVVSRLVHLPEDIHFRDFLWNFISSHIEFIQQNRNLLSFILWELRGNSEDLLAYLFDSIDESDFLPRDHIQQRIGRAIKRGEIKPIHPVHFILNLVSLDVFPFLASPFVSVIFGLSDEEMEKVLQQRKQEVFRLLWNDIKKE